MKQSKYKILFFSLFQECGKEVVWYLLTMTAAVLLGPVLILYRGRILDAAISGGGDFLWELLCFGAASILSFFMAYGNNMGKQRMKKRLYGRFSTKLLDKFSRISYSAYESEETMNIIERMGNAPQEHILEFFSTFLELCSEMISVFCYGAVFATLSFWCLVLGLLAFGLMLFFQFRRIRLMTELYEEQTLEECLMERYEGLLGSKTALYDLRVACADKFLLKKHKKISDRIAKERYRRTIKSQAAYAYGDMVIVAWMAIVLFFVVNSFVNGRMTIGLFVALVGSLQQIIGAFCTIGDKYSELQRRIVFVDYYLTFMGLEEVPAESARISGQGEAGICFEHVTFTYPGRTKPALRDVSFVLEPGTRTALVGHNGSGKSTLVKLMCGLYQPDSGRILIGGQNIADLAPEVLGRYFSVIFQDYGRYFFTVQENVELGDIEKMRESAERRRQEVKAALHKGLADELAGKLEQSLGNLSPDGIELSGGQWQRLALSRACYRDSVILVLDEPTAALDPVAENELYGNFMEMMKKRSCILISHRLAVARYTDRILVLDKGALTEEGSHDSLMRKDGVYASMYRAQSHWYVERI